MALIEWRDEFNTGIPGVDYEHKALIGQINAVYALLEQQPDSETVLTCLDDIYGGVSAHFALEEQLMKEHGYEHYAEHSGDHERLLDDIRAISDDVEASSELDIERLKKRLNEWFAVHFQTHDARLHRLEALIAERRNEGPLKGLWRRVKETVAGRD